MDEFLGLKQKIEENQHENANGKFRFIHRESTYLYDIVQELDPTKDYVGLIGQFDQIFQFIAHRYHQLESKDEDEDDKHHKHDENKAERHLLEDIEELEKRIKQAKDKAPHHSDTKVLSNLCQELQEMHAQVKLLEDKKHAEIEKILITYFSTLFLRINLESEVEINKLHHHNLY